MIKFCEGIFTAQRDKHQWVVIELYDGKDKKGNPKQHSKESYHATLKQVCAYVVDVTAGHAQGAEEMLVMLENAEKLLCDAAEDNLKED